MPAQSSPICLGELFHTPQVPEKPPTASFSALDGITDFHDGFKQPLRELHVELLPPLRSAAPRPAGLPRSWATQPRSSLRGLSGIKAALSSDQAAHLGVRDPRLRLGLPGNCSRSSCLALRQIRNCSRPQPPLSSRVRLRSLEMRWQPLDLYTHRGTFIDFASYGPWASGMVIFQHLLERCSDFGDRRLCISLSSRMLKRLTAWHLAAPSYLKPLRTSSKRHVTGAPDVAMALGPWGPVTRGGPCTTSSAHSQQSSLAWRQLPGLELRHARHPRREKNSAPRFRLSEEQYI